MLRTAASLLALALCAAAPPQGPDPVRVAVVLDGPSDLPPAGVDELMRAVRAAARPGHDVRFPDELFFAGDWTVTGVAALLDSVYRRSDVDLVVAFGAIGSSEVRRREPGLPTVALRALDAERDGPRAPSASGVRNLCLLAVVVDPAADLAAFRALVPFRRLAVVVPSWMPEALPEVSRRLWSELEQLGVDAVRVPLKRTARATLESLPADAEAAYLGPLDQLPREERLALLRGLAERRLPSFALAGRGDVADGALLSLAPDAGDERAAERAAWLAARLLAGDEARSLAAPPLPFGGRPRLALNVGTARAIGVRPAPELVTRAVLVGEGGLASVRRLTLSAALREAVRANRGLLAGEAFVRGAAEDVARAGSALLPRVELGAAWRVLDEDFAVLGNPERTLSAGLSGSQVLWDEGAWAELSVARSLSDARARGQDALALDVAARTGAAYLSVLRARALEEIALFDLDLSLEHAELARVRRELGLAGPSEALRWESRTASARAGVLDARAERRVAEMALNRELHRPLEEAFEAADVGLDDPGLGVDRRARDLFADPFATEAWRAFEVRSGLAAAPELAGLDASIRAAERELVSARRAYWLPTVVLAGSLDDRLAAEGEGEVTPAPLAGLVREPEGTVWQAGVLSRLEVVSGGAKAARERAARQQLIRLRLAREDAAERVELRVRAAHLRAGASHDGIELARLRARAAAGYREAVAESYGRGVAPLVDLLEAQQASVDAARAEAVAVHECALDLMELQRAAGRFDALSPDSARARRAAELEAFLAERAEAAR